MNLASYCNNGRKRGGRNNGGYYNGRNYRTGTQKKKKNQTDLTEHGEVIPPAK